MINGERHATIPVFVTHAACPNLCVFCNQKKIAGPEIKLPEVSAFLESAVGQLSPRFTSCDIAFFGGSFTGIEPERMKAFLAEAAKYLNKGKVTGIRLSTRPDYISDEILDILASYGVTDIELGVQSLDDAVLRASKRGHTAAQTLAAVELIKKRPFRLVLQLMPGLPGDTPETISNTFAVADALKPDAVRIYPTVVIDGTELAELYRKGLYVPLTLDEAVLYTAQAARRFALDGIAILRMGLHSSDLSRNSGVVGGPFHPAFGELVIQRLCYEEARRQLYALSPSPGATAEILTGRGGISRLTGSGRRYLKMLEDEFGVSVIPGEDAARDVKTEKCGLPVLAVSVKEKRILL